MYLINVCIVIAVIFVFSSDAFPYSSSFDIDDIPSPILIDSRMVPRDVFDPYGFNSILTRLVKRDQFYKYPTKRTIDLINRNENDFI